MTTFFIKYEDLTGEQKYDFKIPMYYYDMYRALNIKLFNEKSEYYHQKDEEWFNKLKIHNMDLVSQKNRHLLSQCFMYYFDKVYNSDGFRGNGWFITQLSDYEKIKNNMIEDFRHRGVLISYDNETGLFY